jgi:hypothetical protein
VKYEMNRPTTESEAIEIIDSALRVIWSQIEFYQGAKRKAWNGYFIDHLRIETNHSLAWLADRYPKSIPTMRTRNHEDRAMRDISDIIELLAEIPETLNVTPRQRDAVMEAVGILRCLEATEFRRLVSSQHGGKEK